MVSPDTIVPNPANPQSFNRYSYVNNNPLNFIDPSGNFGICFQQGTGADDDITALSNYCEELAESGAFGPSNEYEVFSNDAAGAIRALAYLMKMMSLYPEDPTVIVGYSWGGGGALEFVWLLNDYGGKSWKGNSVPSTKIDALILIDPVLKWRDRFRRSFYTVPRNKAGHPTLPPIVNHALNIYAATDAYFGDALPWDSGITNIDGAKNIRHSGNHCSVAYQTCELTFVDEVLGINVPNQTNPFLFGICQGISRTMSHGCPSNMPKVPSYSKPSDPTNRWTYYYMRRWLLGTVGY